MNPQNKIKPKRNKDYLQFIRDHHCLLCGYPVSSPHHVRRHLLGAGTSIKPSDYCTLPLCEINQCHDPANEQSVSVETRIIKLMMEYIKYKDYDQLDLIDMLIEFIEEHR